MGRPYAGLHYGAGAVEATGATTRRDTDIDAYGVHAGHQRAFGTNVLGAELDYDRLDGEGGESAGLWRLRARAGMALGRVLPYLGLGLTHYSDDSHRDTGRIYGLGVDFPASPALVVGLDYVRDSIDDVDGNSVDLNGDALRLRASFRF